MCPSVFIVCLLVALGTEPMVSSVPGKYFTTVLLCEQGRTAWDCLPYWTLSFLAHLQSHTSLSVILKTPTQWVEMMFYSTLIFITARSHTDPRLSQRPWGKGLGNFSSLSLSRDGKVSLGLEPVPWRSQGCRFWGPDSCPWAVVMSSGICVSGIPCSLCPLHCLI